MGRVLSHFILLEFTSCSGITMVGIQLFLLLVKMILESRDVQHSSAVSDVYRWRGSFEIY
jgi:hypothetical protein